MFRQHGDLHGSPSWSPRLGTAICYVQDVVEMAFLNYNTLVHVHCTVVFAIVHDL